MYPPYILNNFILETARHGNILNFQIRKKELSQPNSTQTMQKFPLAPKRVLTPGSAHARPSAQPPITVSGNFSAHVSAE